MATTTSAFARALGLSFPANTCRKATGSLSARASRAVQAQWPAAAGVAGRGATSSQRASSVVAAASMRTPMVLVAAPTDSVALQPSSLIDIKLEQAAAASWEGDLLAVAVYEESIAKDDAGTLKNADLKALDEALGGVISELLEDDDFKAGKGSSTFVRLGGKARYFGLVGLGAEEKASAVVDWGTSVWQAAGSAVATAAKSNKAKSAAVAVVGDVAIDAEAATKLSLGLLSGAYESTRFKNKPKPSALESVQILGEVSGSVDAAKAMARGVTLTRYLVEAPPNIATPTHLAEAAAMIAKEFPETMKLEVLEKAECEALGMGCYLGVAEASDHPPKFIHLTYTPKGEVKKKIAVVGKGLTFDSGGYNLKAGAGSMIEMMKFDMGGSGATLGAAMATGGLAPENVEVHFIIASCENMVDGKGLRPGDILTASDGQTVEVNNTDAEGRLTLADALLFAQNNCEAKAVVDIATLTGACMVALGPGIAGLMSPSDSMVTKVTAASKSAGEKLWRLPLESEYMDQLKSPIADMVNTGGRMGGAITAGLFLKEFINEDVEWAHLDIAGPVWNDKLGGATGYGAATLTSWILEEAKEAST